ncbi:MAG TPA: dockerin type I domain-containing protein [Phycisphaerae bacterium]|nr:dockerin type I domain-containing protein [Phycisphaerae bacterium]HRW52446.1 dockerin type I domain-containing protein [Phycisphaerae bacterium]
MSRRRSIPFILASLAAVSFIGATAFAQVPKLLVYEGETLPIEGAVSSVSNPQTNGAGGWCVIMTANDGGGSVNRIFGSPDGVTPAGTLWVEQTVGTYEQTSINTTIDLDDSGAVLYRAVINGVTEPTLFINGTVLMEEETPITTGPLAGIDWDLVSTQMLSFDGVPYYIARVRTPIATEHLMRGTDYQVLLSSGDLLPGLPAIVDDDSTSIESWYGISGTGGEYIAEITMDTNNSPFTTSNDNVVVVSGYALYLDRGIVQEGMPIPASIGGLVGETWDNFAQLEINDFGQVFLTGDSAAATTEDAFVVFDGQVVLREGDILPEGAVSGAINHADMNDQGDWVVFWTVGGVESLILNGEVVVQVGDNVDVDGDGIADATVIDDLPALTSISSGMLELSNRDANGDVTIYALMRADGLNGNDNVDGIYAIKVTPTQASAGDVEVRIDDALDPVTDVPGQIVYNVRVRNRTATPVGSTTVTATIDSTLTGATTSVPSTEIMPNVFEVTYAGLGAYETKVFTVTATAPTGGVKNNSVTVVTAGDPNAANDSDTEETLVGLISDLEIDIADSPDPLYVNSGFITYTVTVTNNGLSDAPNVSVTMNLDPSTTYQSSDAVAVHNAGQITADISGANGLNGPLPANQSYAFNVIVQPSTTGTITTDATVSTTATDPVLGNNVTSEDTTYALESDLRIFIDDNASFITPGAQIVYTVQVQNQGPTDATGVEADVILDAATTLVSVDPPGMQNGANVHATIGALASGASIFFDITVDTSGGPYLKASASVTNTGGELETDTSDNAQDSVTAVFASAGGSPQVIISTINGHATAQVPGLVGREFDSIQQPHPSPDGQNWVIVGDMDGSTADDSVLLRSVSGVMDIVAQEGVTLDELGDPFGVIDNQASINNAGDFALTTNHDPNTFNPQTNTEIAIKNVGGIQTTVVRQGQANFDTFQLYYTDIRSPLIQSDGSIWVYTLMGSDGPPPNYDLNFTGRHIYDDDAAAGGNVQFQALPSSGYPINGTSTPGFFFSSLDRYELTVRDDESQFFINGIADDGVTTKDVAAIGTHDAAPGSALTAVVEEGVALPGMASPVSGITGDNSATVNRMYPNGDWYVLGSNDDGDDWVYSNGAVIASTGMELFPGAGELYDDNGFSAGFFTVCGNSLGDFVIGTRTNVLDTTARNVLVLNNERVLIRSNDPIDLDGNGLYDDDVFVNTFGNYDEFLTDDGTLYFVANLKNGGGSSIGAALLTLNVNCPLFGDINGDGKIDSGDLQGFTDCLLAGNPPSGACVCADLNHDGDVDDADTAMFTSLLVNLP